MPRQVDSGAFRRGFAGMEEDRPVLLISEQVRKLLAKIIDERRAAVEEHRALPLRGPRPAQPNCGSAARGLRQVGGLAPFERFRERADAFSIGGGLKDKAPDLEKPLPNARRECGEN